MSDTHNDTDRRFARNLFSGSDDGQPRKLEQKHCASADDGLDEERRFAADLFAPDDPDAGILAGLTHGKTVGRTRPPRPDSVDRGLWFDRTPIVD